MHKKTVILILSFILIFSVVPGNASYSTIKVYVDDTLVQFSVPPMTINNRTMVPWKAMFTALGVKADYVPETQMVTGTNGNTVIKLKAGASKGTVDGIEKYIDAPAQKVNSEIFIPVRFIAESLNAYVRWDGYAESIYITSDPIIISYIDVGLAECILIQQGGSNLLIDAGYDASNNADNNSENNIILNYMKKQKVDKIDTLILTHPHEDHIGAVTKVINTYETDKIYMPEISAATIVFDNLVKIIRQKGITVAAPVPGEGFKLGNADCTIMAPNGKKYENFNDYSIVLRIAFGSKSFLFTGDAETISVNEILKKGYYIKANVLKIGHHGGFYSTTTDFLAAVSPQYAVISVDEDNNYGLPDNRIINKLIAKGINVYRTDKMGTVVCTSDGTEITFIKKP